MGARLNTRLGILVLAVSTFASAPAMEPRAERATQLRQYLVAEYGSVEASPLATGVWYNLVLPLSKLERFDGSLSSPAATPRQWIQMAYELRRASLSASPLPDYTEFRHLEQEASHDQVHPLAMLFYRYDRLIPGVTPEQAIQYDAQRVTGIDRQAFEEREVFAVAPLYARTYRGAEAHFRIDTRTLYFTNDSRVITSLQIDFGDGKGLRDVGQTADIAVSYPTVGHKTIMVKMTLSDGTVRRGRGEFEVLSLRTPNPSATWMLQAGIPYNGNYSSGEAYLYLADGHSTLTNPAIISEGFDYDNTMNWDALYALLNQQELLETIRGMGYDAVVLNYADAIAPIQQNAYLVEALVDSVNHVIGAEVNSVLLGASMGGLTTRFALAHMESTNHPHQIRTWISFDAPHGGANIPLGVQYWMDFFAGESADAAYLRDILNSPAARQMLVAHFTSPASSVASPDPERGILLNDLAQIGNFPALPRTVAVANGSGDQTGEAFNPGDQLIRWEYTSFLLDITGNVWALPNAAAHNIFYGEWNMIWPFPDRYQTVTLQPTQPWDNAPGGWKNTMAVMDSGNSGYGDIVALHPNHCFIPTISSLDLAVTDPFHAIASDPNLYGLTEFDSLFFPAENQEHVEVTPESFWWFLQETTGPLANPTIVIREAGGSVRLDWTRIQGARSYRVYASANGLAWPESYVLTADTAWTEPDPSPLMRFYRVSASQDAPPVSSR